MRFFAFFAFLSALSAFLIAYPFSGREKKIQRVWIEREGFPLAKMLFQQGIIGNPIAFYLKSLFFRLSVREGEYALSGRMGYEEILAKLARGERVTYKITFPEGFTRREMAERLEKIGILRKEEFLETTKSTEKFRGQFPVLPPGKSLEGYLFPSTYFFPKRTPVEEIISLQLKTFFKMLPPETEPILKKRKLTLHQLVTIASLIEKEAVKDRERPIIAGVIYNRLKKGQKLEIDATVLYALGKHKERVLFRDLDVPSPYNTYRHYGLPPGPICNPGEKSLRAALFPAKHNYLYYVARPDGTHFFSETFQEHKRKKQLAKKEFR